MNNSVDMDCRSFQSFFNLYYNLILLVAICFFTPCWIEYVLCVKKKLYIILDHSNTWYSNNWKLCVHLVNMQSAGKLMLLTQCLPRQTLYSRDNEYFSFFGLLGLFTSLTTVFWFFVNCVANHRKYAFMENMTGSAQKYLSKSP